MGMGDIANSGMQAAMSSMDVISNNISNANTLGFKSSIASFTDLVPGGSDAAGPAIGLGTALQGVQQNFNQGSMTPTGLNSDFAITNNGFFIMKDSASGAVTYTRNGHFSFSNATGYFMNGTQRLQGFAAVNGAIPSGSTPTDLHINTSTQSANASTVVNCNGLNLNSSDQVPTAPFSMNTPTSYNYTTNVTVYDSLGNATPMNLYFVKSAANAWSVYAAVNGTLLNGASPGSIGFTEAGQLSGTTGLTGLSYSPTTGAQPMTLAVNLSGTTPGAAVTQFGNPDGIVAPFTTDGYAAGVFNTYQVDKNGIVTAIYSNGPSVVVGQIALANFQTPQNLQYLGGSVWSATSASGAPTVNPANSTGGIQQAYLEGSNVDLASELVNLIGAQNTFQANAQVEQTYNQVMQTVIKL